MIKPPVERRAKVKKRVPMSLACSYSAEPSQGGTATPSGTAVPTPTKGGEAATFDISEGGMCFYSNKPIETGRTIQVQCNDIWDKPKKGVVRWCQKVHLRLYRVGVQFEDGAKK